MVTLAESATELVDSIVQMPGEFAEVAAHDPVNYVLIAFGALFVAAASAVFGYLSLGAFFSLFTGASSPPPEAR
ncbi:hypothetical protein HZS55_02160 [Halosimplex rubrum]|uniref:Uncharacterized protein n=1 Tax=Halosimplex rubrum TaxID=869889 RepID=A0A7D5P727_9EURY|nr:hypothetical protein [Halosimplex rubrum]QLH76180.1 hypothetical protein HZS55_02160 [Halosimplex rubrum]